MSLDSSSVLNRTYKGLAAFDLAWLICSPFIALWLRDPSFVDPSGLPFTFPVTYQYAFLTILSSIPFFLIFRLSDGITHLFSSRDVLSCLAATTSSVIASVFTVFSFSRLEGVPRPVPIIFGLVLLFGLLSYRLTVKGFYERQIISSSDLYDRLDATSLRRILIIGTDPFAISAMRLIDSQHPRTAMVVACISLQGKYVGRSIKGIKVSGALEDMGKIIDEYRVHGVSINQIWVSDSSQYFSASSWDLIKKVCFARGIHYEKLSDVFGLTPQEVGLKNIQDRSLSFDPPYNGYYLLKRILDIICAVFLCIILSPIFLISVLLTLFDLGPPVLFWQERIGRYGRTFRLYKIRTLARPLNEYGQVIEDESRLSSMGKIIRRLRFDEIPQLINIIVGEMSGIGPRPLLPRDQPRDQFVRLLIRPGITGWAQVNGGELLHPEEKNFLDCWYVYNASLSLDIYIVIKTFVLFVKGVKRNEEQINQAKEWMITQKSFVFDP